MHWFYHQCQGSAWILVVLELFFEHQRKPLIDKGPPPHMQLGRMFNAVKLAPEMNELFTIAIEYHVSCNFVAGACEAAAARERVVV